MYIPIALSSTTLLDFIGIGINEAMLAKVLWQDLGLGSALALGSLVVSSSEKLLDAGRLALAMGSSAVRRGIVVFGRASHDC